MKREKVAHGYYHKMRKHDKKYRHLVGGRSPMNMGDMKYYEYADLLRYIHLKLEPHFGYCIVIYRFYKNMKYRKTFIRLMNKNKAE